MALADILFSPALLAALAAYAVLSLAAAWFVAVVEDRLDEDARLWLWGHFYAPLLRAAALCAFLLMAYPTLFGLDAAPPVSSLLFADEARPGHILGVVFVLSLVLPLLPLRYTGPALVLPIQGIAAATLLFHWLTEATDRHDVSLWVGLPTLALVAIMAVATHLLAGRLLDGVHHAGRQAFGVADLDVLLEEFLVLLIQGPVILVYTLSLGANLAAAGGSPP